MRHDTTSHALHQKGLALGGFMGTGKSTLARALAEHTGLPWIDTDRELVRAYGSIAQQFARDGESVFRVREASIVRSTCMPGRRIVSTGGGVFADQALRHALRDHYVLVCLRASIDTLRQRLENDDSRPLWTDHAEQLLRQRTPDYLDVHVIIDVDGKSVSELIAEVLACIP